MNTLKWGKIKYHKKCTHVAIMNYILIFILHHIRSYIGRVIFVFNFKNSINYDN